MLLYFATFCIGLASSYSIVDSDFTYQDSDAAELFWPDTFSVKVTQMSLTSNLVLEVQQWKTNQSSRIDYNGGSVKSLTILSDPEGNGKDGLKYQILPVTSDGKESEEKCYQIPDPLPSLTSILPKVENEGFEAVGNETVLETETVKFEKINKEFSKAKETRETIWAEYSLRDEEPTWIPVRFENKVFNSQRGSLISHDIWDFYEFEIDFDDDVFKVADKYDCGPPGAVKHTAESDAVIKELMFIDPHEQTHVDHVFNKYIDNFERKYAHDEEHATRKSIFNENMRIVSAVNKKNIGYKLSINEFSDQTPEELEKSRGLIKQARRKTGNIAFPYDEVMIKETVENLPKEYDARLDGLVTPVKHQGKCGSCWAFGSTAAAEGALAKINGGRLMTLSDQALVDCVWFRYGAGGCIGGTDKAAFEWMMDYGLPTVEEYGPYKRKEDYCHIANMTKKFPIRGYTDVMPFSNEAAKVALFNHGPLSVSVSTTKEFMHYSSGIFYQEDCGTKNLNHEVTLIGYGEKYGELFWILKNSWGTTWGSDGYMLIAAKDNICGVTTEPTYVVF